MRNPRQDRPNATSATTRFFCESRSPAVRLLGVSRRRFRRRQRPKWPPTRRTQDWWTTRPSPCEAAVDPSQRGRVVGDGRGSVPPRLKEPSVTEGAVGELRSHFARESLAGAVAAVRRSSPSAPARSSPTRTPSAYRKAGRPIAGLFDLDLVHARSTLRTNMGVARVFDTLEEAPGDRRPPSSISPTPPCSACGRFRNACQRRRADPSKKPLGSGPRRSRPKS